MVHSRSKPNLTCSECETPIRSTNITGLCKEHYLQTYRRPGPIYQDCIDCDVKIEINKTGRCRECHQKKSRKLPESRYRCIDCGATIRPVVSNKCSQHRFGNGRTRPRSWYHCKVCATPIRGSGKTGLCRKHYLQERRRRRIFLVDCKENKTGKPTGLDRIAFYLKERRIETPISTIASDLNLSPYMFASKMGKDKWGRFEVAYYKQGSGYWKLKCWNNRCSRDECERWCHPHIGGAGFEKYCTLRCSGLGKRSQINCYNCGKSLAEKYTQKEAEMRVRNFGSVHCNRSCARIYSSKHLPKCQGVSKSNNPGKRCGQNAMKGKKFCHSHGGRE